MSKHNETRYITTTRKTAKNNTFIILSAGTGRRTKNYGNKSLIEYENKRVIDHQINTIKSAYGNSAEIILVTGFDSHKVISQIDDLRIVENNSFEQHNILESMRIGINTCLESNIFFIHGDIIFSESFIKPPNQDHIYVPVDTKSKLDRKCIGVTTTQEKVTNFSYGLYDKWAQIVFFPKHLFKDLKTKLNKLDKNLCSFELMNYLIKKGYTISYYECPRGRIKEIKSAKDFL